MDRARRETTGLSRIREHGHLEPPYMRMTSILMPGLDMV